MRTIRGKLFISVGILLILIAALNYFVPKYFIAKNTEAAAKGVLNTVDELQNQLHQSIMKCISHYFKKNTTDLNSVAVVNFAQEVADSLKKPLIIADKNSSTQLFQKGKSPVLLDNGTFSATTTLFFWQGIAYIPFSTEVGPLTIGILTPSSEVDAIPRFLARLGKELEHKIFLNLFLTGFVGLVSALILLSRLSKRITKPIAELALASQKIGEGKYEGIILPDVEGRKDEVATFAHSFQNMAMALADREKVHGVLNKVVSSEIASEILQGNVELGGEEREVTLLFCDIRNFTELSNHLHPKEIIEMLNDYLTTLCQIIDKTKGVVDKFVGDEIIALYGAPLALSHHADHALEGAIGMVKALREWNDKRLVAGKVILEVGIGLHTGIVCVGNMGASNRLNYTVIGANVNLAARLCAIAKPMQILLTTATKEALSRKYSLKSIEPVLLKGFDAPIPIFEVSV